MEDHALDANDDKPLDGRDRRQFKRMPTLFKGTLSYAGRSAAVVVLDVSMNGAKLRLTDEDAPPDSFILTIDRLGEFQAEVVWRKENRLGVRFHEAPDAVDEALPETFADRLRGNPREG